MKTSERLEEIRNIIDKVRMILSECYPHVKAIKLDMEDMIPYEDINDIDHDFETVDYMLMELSDRFPQYIGDTEDREYQREREEEER